MKQMINCFNDALRIKGLKYLNILALFLRLLLLGDEFAL